MGCVPTEVYCIQSVFRTLSYAFLSTWYLSSESYWTTYCYLQLVTVAFLFTSGKDAVLHVYALHHLFE